jgi:hypothetical protein
MSKTKELLDAYWDTREQRLEADVQRFYAERDLILGIKWGLDKTLTLEQAAKIKAARGDQAAIDWLARRNSRQVRLKTALCTAAMDMHPERWLRVGRDYIWRDEGEMPNVDATVEQFQKEHPAEARAIEAKIDAEGGA